MNWEVVLAALVLGVAGLFLGLRQAKSEGKQEGRAENAEKRADEIVRADRAADAARASELRAPDKFERR